MLCKFSASGAAAVLSHGHQPNVWLRGLLALHEHSEALPTMEPMKPAGKNLQDVDQHIQGLASVLADSPQTEARNAHFLISRNHSLLNLGSGSLIERQSSSHSRPIVFLLLYFPPSLSLSPSILEQDAKNSHSHCKKKRKACCDMHTYSLSASLWESRQKQTIARSVPGIGLLAAQSFRGTPAPEKFERLAGRVGPKGPK